MRKLLVLLFLLSCRPLGAAAGSNEGQVVSIPTQIMGEGQLAPRQLYAIFATAMGSDARRAERLAPIYVEEAATEGVNHDVAFAQMILETGFLRFAGVVRPHMNNFCGLGAVSAAKNGHSFPDERAGVRAHIQHLKAYASTDSLCSPLVDPRYHFVSPRGKSPTVDGLVGTWAQDPQYAAKLKSVLRRMYTAAL